jgi:hypothetical protein
MVKLFFFCLKDADLTPYWILVAILSFDLKIKKINKNFNFSKNNPVEKT